jgi:hypothetical protein
MKEAKNMPDLIQNYVDDLRHTVTVASANYDIWWVYKSKDTRPEYVDTMNDYTLFFHTSIHAHFVALLVALYRIYEKRKDSYNVPGFLDLLRQREATSPATLEKLQALFTQAKPLWIKVGILRNEAFGHRSHERTVGEVFDKAGISGNSLSDLIKLTQELLNTATLAWDSSFHAFNLSTRNDTLQLLANLKAQREKEDV